MQRPTPRMTSTTNRSSASFLARTLSRAGVSPASILTSLMLLSSPAIVCAQQASAERPRYDIFWDVRQDQWQLQHGEKVDWASQITFNGVPLNGNFWTIGEDVLADDVRRLGLHITRRADWRDTLAKRLQRNLDTRIPADAEGFGSLDIEFLPFAWGDRTGGPGLRPGAGPNTRKPWDLWYEYIRTERPELIAGKSTAQAEDILDKTYMEATRDFITTLLQEAKRLRPKLKWGMYGYPNWRNQEYGYPDPNPARMENDKLKWLWDASDAAYPSLYQGRAVVPDGTPITDPSTYVSSSFNRNFMATNIREARRVIGNDKPVIPFVMLVHPEYTNLPSQFLNDANLQHSIEYPKQVGADGVVIWGVVDVGAYKNALQNYMNTKFLPMATGVVSAPRSTGNGSQGPNPNSKLPPQARLNEDGNVRKPRSFASGNQPMVAPPPKPNARPASARPARPGVTRVVVVPNDGGQ